MGGGVVIATLRPQGRKSRVKARLSFCDHTEMTLDDTTRDTVESATFFATAGSSAVQDLSRIRTANYRSRPFNALLVT